MFFLLTNRFFFLILWFLSPSLHSFYPSHILPCFSLLYPVDFFLFFILPSYSHLCPFPKYSFLTFLIFLSIFLPSISWPFVVTHNICLEYSNANFNCYISSQILSGTKVSPKVLVFQYFQENFKTMLFL